MKPAGGTGLYALPMDLTKATTVTLQYSVNFGAGFDWVLGGKLPGLYGGRTGCTGGSLALDCYSARFMVSIHLIHLIHKKTFLILYPIHQKVACKWSS